MMSTGVDWDALASTPGTLPKPKKREKKPKEPKPRKPLKKRNEKRATSAHAEDFAIQAAACRGMPCYACGAPGPSQPHHEPPRSVGGSDADTVPLCIACHARRHAVGARPFWSELGKTPEEAKAHVREQAGITIYG